MLPIAPQDAKLDLKPTFEYRSRYEQRIDRDFNSNALDNRFDLFNRIRPGLKLSYERWSAELQYQYSHNLAWTRQGNFSRENSDASLAFLKYTADEWSFTAGRQRISIGSGRLIGTSDWSNAPRSVDGFRLQGGALDVFGFEPAVALSAPINTRYFGAAYNSKIGTTLAVLKTDDTDKGTTSITTLNHLWTGRAGEFALEAEAALQGGRKEGRDVEAWALHFKAAHPLGEATTAFLEYNSASGGGDAGKTRTFDQLNASNHSKYGTMDLLGWRNMNEWAIGFEGKAGSQFSWSASWRYMTLRDPSDSWYGDNGSAILTDPSGQSGREVGHELDIEGAWKFDKRSTVSAGIGLFMPGSFVRNAKGGHADRQTWAFVQYSFKF